jgi:hypothetical protein
MKRFRQRALSLPRRAKATLAKLSDLPYWMVNIGSLLAMFFVVVFAIGVIQLGGFWTAYAVLVGGTPPQNTPHAFTALCVSLMGWLAVPAVVGAVAGLVVERQVHRHQSQPLSVPSTTRRT